MERVIRPSEFPTENKFLIFLFKLAAFLVAIPIVFIYMPLRWVSRLIADLFLFILDRNKEGEDTKAIIFFKSVKATHGYEGDNLFLKYLDKYILGEKENAQRNRNFIFFLVPSLGSFTLFVLVPFLMGVYYSFTNWTGLNSGSEVLVGFLNYSTIFKDYLFIYSFIRTVTYSVLNVVFINVVAFSLALLVTQKLKLKNVYRAGFFLPNLIGGLVLGYIWQFVYSTVFPAIGTAIGASGGIFSHSLIGSNANATEAMGALLGVVTWQYAGYIMMIYIAALLNVPQDLVEASKIDGANAFQRLRTIIFPLVAQAFTISLFLTLVTSFKQYDTVQALTQGGPAVLIPKYLADAMGVADYTSVRSLDLMAINIYNTAFTKYQMGIGQAKAIVFFLILMVISIAQVTYNQKKEVEL